MDEMNNNYTPEQQPVQPQYQQPVQPQYQQPVQPQYQQPVQPQYQQPVQYPQTAPQTVLPAGAPTPKMILILGIISLAVSWIPFLGIGGIIIGAIGMSKSNAYVRAGGVACGMSITGRILSRIGLIVSIVMTVIWAIYLLVIIIAVAAYSGYHYSYY